MVKGMEILISSPVLPAHIQISISTVQWPREGVDS